MGKRETFPKLLHPRIEHSQPSNMNNSTNATAANPSGLCDQDTSLESIFYAVFLVFIMVATIFGNALVITAVYMFPRLRRMTNFFIVSLAVSDLLVGLMHLPLRIDMTVHNGKWCQPVAACAYWATIDAVFSAASICNLAVISVDRYLAITRPFDYLEFMTKFKATGVIACVWTYACLWGLLGLFGWETGRFPIHISQNGVCQNANRIYYTTTACFSFFLPLLVTIIMYSFVFRVALKQAQAMAKMDPGKKRRRHMVREMKATKTLAVVVGVFTVSWLPFFTLLIMSFWCIKCVQPMADYPELGTAIHAIFVSILPPTNSCVNPIIYSVFNSEFRGAFRRMLTGKRETARYANVEYELSVTESNHNRTDSIPSQKKHRSNEKTD